MGKLIDITNHKYGKWLVIERDTNKDSKRNVYWKCINEETKEIKSISKSNLIKHEELFLKNKDISYVVYKHTSPSNKSYIGITSTKPTIRWGKDGNNYLRMNGHHKFKRAIEKYGWDNFTHEILEENISHRLAQDFEKYYIKKYDSYYNGYNATLGGEHNAFLNKHHTEEVKKFLSEKQKGKPSPNLGNKWTNEQKEHLRKINIGKCVSEDTRKKISKLTSGKNNPNFGVVCSEEKRNKIKMSQNNRKMVECNKIIFNSVNECAKYYNKDVGTISNWLNKIHKMPYDFYKLNLRYYGDYKTIYEYHTIETRSKKIICDGIIYNSIRQFSLRNNINYTMTQTWLNNKKPMPKKWLDRGLRYYNPETDKDLPIYVDTKDEM